MPVSIWSLELPEMPSSDIFGYVFLNVFVFIIALFGIRRTHWSALEYRY